MGAEILERVERAAPENASSDQRHGDRAQVGEEEERDGEWVGQDIHGPDAGDFVAGDVEAGDSGVLDESGGARPSTGPERGRKAEAVEGEEIFLQVADDTPSSVRPADGGETGTEDDTLTVAGSLELPADAHVFDDFHGERIEAADALIARATHEVEGTNSKKILALLVWYSPEADSPNRKSVHGSVHASFAGRCQGPVRHKDEMIGLAGDGVAQR